MDLGFVCHVSNPRILNEVSEKCKILAKDLQN